MQGAVVAVQEASLGLEGVAEEAAVASVAQVGCVHWHAP